jgi:hypothetical protein
VTEVAQDIFLIGGWGQPWVALCSKKNNVVEKIKTLSSDEKHITDVRPLPGFNLRTFPFCMIRTNRGINLVDL